MSNGFAKTNMEDSKILDPSLSAAVVELNQELAIRLQRNRNFFGSVKLELLFTDGKPKAHRITVDYTTKPQE